MNERTIHVRLVGGISENRERYISTGSFAPPASIGDISQIRGHIHDIVVEYAEQWINDTDSPGEIETLEFTLSPAYINILCPMTSNGSKNSYRPLRQLSDTRIIHVIGADEERDGGS